MCSRLMTRRRIEPKIELGRNYELSGQDLGRALQLVVDHE
jgi:hypothetical protein